MLARKLADRNNGSGDVGALSRRVHGLTAAQERVAAKCDDHAHELAVTAAAAHRRKFYRLRGRYLPVCDNGSGLEDVCAG